MTAHISENLLKFTTYFKPTYFYWRLTPPSSWKNDNFPIGRYPLNMIDRIKTGHYYKFDKKGLPLMVSTYGKFHGKKLIHYYTTLSSYAFAHWDLFLMDGKKNHADIIMNTADYMIKTGISTDTGTFLLKCENEKGEHGGDISAMDQGMAIGVFVRAWLISGKEFYLDYAFKILKTFEFSIENGGVVGYFSRIDDIWYEEDIEFPLFHILNGKIYSLWGIKDLYEVTKDDKALKIFEKGLNSLKKGLKYFDAGFWSWYWYPENDKKFYIASMMYQNLHICQLKALYYQTGDVIFKNYADLFFKYASNPFNRLKAGFALLKSKIKG